MSEWKKSSYSTYNGDCVEVAWHKSSYSGYNGNCVEVAETPDVVLVRDSKDAAGPVLEFSVQEWRAFVRQLMTDHASKDKHLCTDYELCPHCQQCRVCCGCY